VEQGKASCSGDQLRQVLQSAVGDGETVSGTPSSEEVRRAAKDSFGTHKKGNIHRWKPLPSNGREDMTVDTCVRACVTLLLIVNCKV
jgi:hypothetical protein